MLGRLSRCTSTSRHAARALINNNGYGCTSGLVLSNNSQTTSNMLGSSSGSNRIMVQQSRNYRHWWHITMQEYELQPHTMPGDIKELIQDPMCRDMDFYDHYWYWRIRKESTILNPERLVTLNYKQLAYDMGMGVPNEATEHQIGLVELYEYLKSTPMIGPFGTIENPVLIPCLSDARVVACTGGTGEDEHYSLYFNCREGFLYRCGECDQIFMLVRVSYGNSWCDPQFIAHKELFSLDADVEDVFDIKLLENAHKRWNEKDMMRWRLGAMTEGSFPICEDKTENKIMTLVRDPEQEVGGTSAIDEPNKGSISQ